VTARAAGADERWTILRVLEWTADRFAQAGLESPRLEAEVLLAHGLGVERLRLYLDHDKPLRQEELAAFRQTIRRRLAREPLAYITGEREFWSLGLLVDRAVLIPRPETELLVELSLAAVRARDAGADGEQLPLTIVDVGTGSGAIAVALARELPTARVLATEIDPAALAVARKNVERCGVGNLELFAGDLLEGLPEDLRADLIAANPPYICSAELAGLQPEVARWEPARALDGGEDGLAVIRRLVPQAARRLTAGGALLLEIGCDQGAEVRALLEAVGFCEVVVHTDLAGLDRVVAGVWQGEHR